MDQLKVKVTESPRQDLRPTKVGLKRPDWSAIQPGVGGHIVPACVFIAWSVTARANGVAVRENQQSGCPGCRPH